MKKDTLWTRDFSIITIGTIISMLGNAVSGFAIGLIVLDFTGSTFMYALFMVVYSIPKLIMPLLAGPYLDRYSRKKAIYSLDFISSGIYAVIFVMLLCGLLNNFNFVVFIILLILAFVIGSIDSIYLVAYDSLYPNLVPEGKMSKAYSISSLLYPISAIMVPVAAICYSNGLVAWLFLFNAVTFLTAAIIETFIKGGDTHAATEKKHTTFAEYKVDFKEGLRYIFNEKGLLVITVFFFVTNFATSGSGTLILPYFKNFLKTEMFTGAELYTVVMAFALIGRVVGGTLHYRINIPKNLKYKIAILAYTATTVVEASYLFLPIPAMMCALFISGLLAVNSYNIRISSTQAYVPDDHRARFNSVFQMIFTLGGIIGQLIAGAAADFLPAVGIANPTRGIIIALMAINAIAIVLVMVRGRKHVEPIYNVDLSKKTEGSKEEA